MKNKINWILIESSLCLLKQEVLVIIALRCITHSVRNDDADPPPNTMLFSFLFLILIFKFIIYKTLNTNHSPLFWDFFCCVA